MVNVSRRRLFAGLLAIGVAIAVGLPMVDRDPPPPTVPTLSGVPASLTAVTNPSIGVAAPDAVGYKYSINGGPYSEQRGIAQPIQLAADVRIGAFTAPAGSRALSDYLNLRRTDAAFERWIDRVDISNAASPLQLTYLVNPRRASVLAENVLNLNGSGVTHLAAEVVEKTPPGAREELSAFVLDGGNLTQLPSEETTRRFRLTVPAGTSTVPLVPFVNNAATSVLVNGVAAAAAAATAVAVGTDSTLVVETVGAGGARARYEIEIVHSDALAEAPRRAYYLRAFTPAQAYFRIRNTGAAAASYQLLLNDRFGKTTAALEQELLDMPEAFPGEPLHRKAWRLVKASRSHGVPITSARWLHSPSVLFNSVGLGFCDDAASAFAVLLRNLGYTTRVWGLDGHVVPEVLINGRWEMYDADLEVYYKTRGGQIAGVADLAAEPDLIINPTEVVPGNIGGAEAAYYAGIYASTQNNAVQPWYTDPAVLVDPPMTFTAPAGSVLEFPDLYDAPLYSVEHAPLNGYANARLMLPAGFEGSVAMPLVIQSIGWTSRPSLAVMTVDSSGNWSAPATATWDVDADAPFTAVAAAANNTVALSRNEPGQTFYTTDTSAAREAFVPYSEPIAVPANGFRYYSVDAVGNAEIIRAYGPPPVSITGSVVGQNGNQLTLVANAQGGTGSYEYQYLLPDAGGGWIPRRDFSSDNSWVWDHTGHPGGRHTISVCARNTGSGATGAWCHGIAVDVPPPPTAPTLEDPGDQVNDDYSGSYADVVVRAAPVGYWRFGEASGSTSPALIGGAAILLGELTRNVDGALADGDKALGFGGANFSVRLPHPAASLAGDVTIEMWINVGLASRQTLISAGFLREFELTVEQLGNLNFYFGNGTTFQNVMTVSGLVRANEWQHLAVVRDATAGTIRFYVDGQLRDTKTYTLTPIGSLSPISLASNGGSQHVTGRIDEVALYARALRADEISAHHTMRLANGGGTPVLLPLIASDVNGDALQFRATGLPAGLSIDADSGVISGFLEAASAGVHEVVATVTDGVFSTDTAFTWTVRHVNRPPILDQPSPPPAEATRPVTLQITGRDPDGDTLTFSAAGLPAGLSIDPASGLISGTPGANTVGLHSVTITLSDGAATGIQSFVWNVIPARHAPALVNPGPQTNPHLWNFGEAVLADSPVGYWRLGDGAGNVADDRAGTNDGTRFGTITTGAPGAIAEEDAAMLFDGATGYVRVPNVPGVSLAGDLSIELWVNVALTERHTVISKGYSREFELTIERSGHLNFYHGAGGSYQGMQSPVAPIRANTWHHVVVTRSMATKTITYYVDGVSRGTRTFTMTPQASANALHIGRSVDPTRWVRGRLDEVAVYPRMMTAAQVATHFTARNVVDEPTRVALQLIAPDEDGDTVTFAATGLPPGVSVNVSTGLLSGTLTQPGVYLVTATASDNSLSSSESFTWTVTRRNRAPLLANPGDMTADENTAVSVQLTGSDPDGDTLTYTATGLPSGLTLSPSGLLDGTLTYDSAGAHAVVITASDGTLVATQAFSITVRNVNRVPTIADPGPQLVVIPPPFAKLVSWDEPAGYWRLGDASVDVFGGVATGQPGALGDGDPAMQFDGTTGYARVPSPTAALDGDLTLELWINVSLANRQTLISKGFSNEFELTVERDGRLNFYNGTGAAYAGLISASTGIRANQWHHVVVTRTAATRAIAFYVDGVPRGGGTIAMAARGSANPLLLGRSSSPLRYVDGRIDDVAVYDKALTATQVGVHYAARNITGLSAPQALQLAGADADGQPLTYAATGLPPGLTLNPTTGVISGIVNVAAEGTYSVTVTISDGTASAAVVFPWVVAVR